MAADKMSIAFLAAPSQAESAPVVSSVSHIVTTPAQQDFRCARVDSHQDIANPVHPRLSTLPTATPSEVQSPNDQSLREARESSTSSSANDDGYSGTFRRQPRSPRPTYSEEQRFFVMYARLVQDKSWPDIEDDFATIFKQRSKGGLCSLYYRIRRSWGLEDVLKSDSNYWTLERRIVDERAYNFSRDFLLSIGYLRHR